MTPNLNDFQGAQLRTVVAEHAAEVRAGYGRECDAPALIRGFACDVPGMACVQTSDGMTLELLYPTPRPVPRDPLFQHAESVHVLERSLAGALMLLHSQHAMRRDWQAAEGAAMDAPQTMPAGACEYTEAADDAYGAHQITIDRDA